jgi:translocator protein
MPAMLKLALSVVLVLAVGFTGSFFTASSVNDWYTTIEKPSWNPPGWLFGPVWTVLYIMIGLALYRLWTAPVTPLRKWAIYLFFVQMALNFFWSIIFFGCNEIGWALAEIVTLWVVIGLCILLFGRVSYYARNLFIPYWLWVTFAMALNFEIWRLN